jgi:hypothetical protein
MICGRCRGGSVVGETALRISDAVEGVLLREVPVSTRGSSHQARGCGLSGNGPRRGRHRSLVGRDVSSVV